MINYSSGNQEWFTPPEIMNPVRSFLGEIDLDPAGSYLGNERFIGAKHFISKPEYPTVGEINGLPVLETKDWGSLDVKWVGRVWLNHPFGKPENRCSPVCAKKTCLSRGFHTSHGFPGTKDWIKKLINEFEQGNVEEALTITFASTSESWFRDLFQYPRIWVYGRVNYLTESGETVSGSTKGSVITCLTRQDRLPELSEAFGGLGHLDVPLDMGISNFPVSKTTTWSGYHSWRFL